MRRTSDNEPTLYPMKQVRWTFWLGSSLGKDLGLPRWRLDLDRDYEAVR